MVVDVGSGHADEVFRADHGAGMDQATLPESDAVTQRDVGMKTTVRSDLHIGADQDLAEARRDRRRQRAFGAAPGQDNRPHRTDGNPRLFRFEVDVVARAGQAVLARQREHDGERLVRPLLAFAQPSHGRLVQRIANEVVAADALDGDDLAFVDGTDGP